MGFFFQLLLTFQHMFHHDIKLGI